MNPKEEAAEALIGTVLEGAYRIDGLVGKGGMGAVYRGTHLRLNKPIAVKVMVRELADNSEAFQRFNREALVTSGLGDPHIVQVFDFAKAPGGEPFLVMEMLEGEDLDHRLRREGRLSPALTAHVIKQTASALSAAHAKGIVHRDLKPGNIFLMNTAAEPDFVKVLDFGISKVRSATTKLTRAESVMGTPDYMSPEQARGAIDEIDDGTDQWALACIAWECLSGRAPFVGDSIPSLLFQVVHQAPKPLVPQVPGLSPEVEEVLLRALAKNRKDRFAGVSEFAAALELGMSGKPGVLIKASESASLPHTEQLPVVEEPKEPRPPTTFGQTAGEVGKVAAPAKPRPVWFWPVVGGAAAVALVVAVTLAFRPGHTRDVSATTAVSATAPASPVAPPPSAPEPARVAPAPSAHAPSAAPALAPVEGKTGPAATGETTAPQEQDAVPTPSAPAVAPVAAVPAVEQTAAQAGAGAADFKKAKETRHKARGKSAQASSAQSKPEKHQPILMEDL